MEIINNLIEAEKWFLNNSYGQILCVKNNGKIIKIVNNYKDAKKFFNN